MRTSEEQRIRQIQFLQLVMNGLLEREGAFCVLASRRVTKLRRHEQLHARGLLLVPRAGAVLGEQLGQL